LLTPPDLSVISQLRKQGGFLGIEQPEFHFHSAIQIGMRNLYIRAAASDPNKFPPDKTLIIETHVSR